ncbi:hypothetical protein BS17DRAFT_771587, partial [Gyrodon lividus]
VISPVSCLHPHYAIPNHYAPRPTARDRYLAAIAQAEADYVHAQALQERRVREGFARRQHQENTRRQLVLDALRAEDNEDYNYDHDYPAYSRCRANLKRPLAYSAYAPELQERRTRQRQAALEQAAREREGQLNARKKLVAARRQQEETRRAQQAQQILDMFVARPQVAEAKQHAEEVVPVKDRLESRLMNEYESDIRDALQSLLDSLSPTQSTPASSSRAAEPIGIEVTPHVPETTQDTKGKSKQVTFDVPVGTGTVSDSETDSEAEAAADPSSIRCSLSTIEEIDTSFRALQSEFEFPEELDFSPSTDGSELTLAYSSRNAPLRFYDHALSQLLSRLDAVPSYGSRKVRDARKMMVREIEDVLEEVEREVERKKNVAAWKVAKAKSAVLVEAGEVTAEPVEVIPEPVEVTAEPVETPEPVEVTPEPVEVPPRTETDHHRSAHRPSEPETTILDSTPDNLGSSADPSEINSTIEAEAPCTSVTQLVPISDIEPTRCDDGDTVLVDDFRDLSIQKVSVPTLPSSDMPVDDPPLELTTVTSIPGLSPESDAPVHQQTPQIVVTDNNIGDDEDPVLVDSEHEEDSWSQVDV